MRISDWSSDVCSSDLSPIRLAGGENLRGETAFGAAIDAGDLSLIQPDVAKWGGVSGCLAVARRALAAGRVYCPHYLGGGIGLAASAHLRSAEHTSELQSLMRNSYAVFCLNKKNMSHIILAWCHTSLLIKIILT